MKSAKPVLVLMTILIVTLLSLPHSLAAPNEMNFQGRLTDLDGNPAVDGFYIMEFLVYDSETGGSYLWWEQQEIYVQNSIYNVILGRGTPYHGSLDAALFSGNDRWFEVRVNGFEFSPRQKLTSVAYALQAASVDNDSITTDMLQSQSITVEKIADDTLTGAKIEDGSITSQDISGGSGSGLDSDKLDGLDGSYYASAAQLNTLQETVTALQALVTTLQSENQELKNKLQHFSVSGNQIYITGANLHVRNSSGSTDGAVDGLGNVIIGYDEARSWFSCTLGNHYYDQQSCEADGGLWWMNNKTGSHNLVVGAEHSYSRYGGIVAGAKNTIFGNFSSVTGGRNHIVTGEYASVSGGINHTATGIGASVSGGSANFAIGDYSSVSGGVDNWASGSSASVSGGHASTASGDAASVSGGQVNNASGDYSSVSGGTLNESSGRNASVSGGIENTASGEVASVSGGRNNDASGDVSFIGGGGSADSLQGNVAYADYSAILGGNANLTGDPVSQDRTVGEKSTISGGSLNTASGNLSSVSGGYHNEASGEGSSVSGGNNNSASGLSTSVSGGNENTASSYSSSVSGGQNNRAEGYFSSVSGGGSYDSANGNIAYAIHSSILGGIKNITGVPASGDITIGQWATISGGQNNKAEGDYSSVSGGGSDNPAYGNVAYANYSSILGGIFNITGDPDSQNHSVAERSTISGGDSNRAIGTSSTVSGGVDNHAEGLRSTVSGGAHLYETVNEGYESPNSP